jgi:SM-20-related protein
MNAVPDVAFPGCAKADARCPHLVFRDVLGTKTVAGLLDFVAARKGDFRPAVVRNRDSGERRVDYGLRDCLYLMDLGAFEAPLKAFVGDIAAATLASLQPNEALSAPGDFEIAAYGNGGHFGSHIDTDERVDRVRVLSCVYYFAAMPSRFSGGELRLHGLPILSGGHATQSPFVDVMPDTDTLVVFPSWLRHEVLPVHVPSGAWEDRRFSVNCWIHRAHRPARDVPNCN